MIERFPKTGIEQAMKDGAGVSFGIVLRGFEPKDKSHDRRSLIFPKAKEGCAGCPIRGERFIPINAKLKSRCTGLFGKRNIQISPFGDPPRAYSEVMPIEDTIPVQSSPIIPCGIKPEVIFVRIRSI